MKRRDFNKNMMLSICSAGLFSNVFCHAPNTERLTFLIVSGWQTVNIGDIAHTPGLLAFLDRYFPNAHYYLWPRDIEGYGVEQMLSENFPKLKVIKGNYNKNDLSITPELQTVFDTCDMLLHGSGPHVMERDKIKTWLKHTNKPFGVCGVTVQNIDPEVAEIIDLSAFFLTRETKSLENVRTQKEDDQNTAFFTDATFNLNLKNEEKAATFLRESALTEKNFICVIPRLRYTPYYKIHDYIQWSDEKIAEVNAINDRYKEIDHAKIRQVMTRWVRETGKKVLVCPEMTYQTEIMDELLIHPLPDDVKPHVQKRGYWTTDEAASVYKRAFAVMSMECHSPIIAYANKTPAFYIRQKEDTIKGQMYYDLGLDDWLFEIDQTTGDVIYDRLLEVISDYSAAQQKISNAYKIIEHQNQLAARLIRKTGNHNG